MRVNQNLSFGAFCTGSTGGTVKIPSVGSRSKTGTVILIPSNPGYPAIVQVTVNNVHSIAITISNIVNLRNGSGGRMTLSVNDFYPASPFMSTIGVNTIRIGGTLTVGSQASTPAGNYTGSFNVTLNEP